ncbi:MAG: pyridoxamine 5'-phosphate oxidase [bacterium]|nr:pyridoxamine 5'-phosphate oxidase [bacterium]
MSKQEVFEFANANQGCFLSTVETTPEGNQPRVRGVMMWFADETGFYFHTSTAKNVCGQIQATPKVEVCYFKLDPYPGKMLRVAGEVEFLSDPDLKARLVEERPFLKDIEKATEGTDADIALFRIVRGEAHFWTMADNMNEKNLPRVEF